MRATIEAFKGWVARYGGGLMRDAVTAQLRYYAELVGARCPEPIRGELLTAVGSFVETAGYMAYDDFAYDDAQRAYHFALACAEEAENWYLRAQVLCSMAEQASWCGDPDTGLAYTESALVRAIRLTATERAMLHNSRDCDLARLGHGQYIAETHNRLTRAIAARAEGVGRARTSSQLKLARLIMVTGDPSKPPLSAPRPWTGQAPPLPPRHLRLPRPTLPRRTPREPPRSSRPPRSSAHHPRRRLRSAIFRQGKCPGRAGLGCDAPTRSD